ncbi:MAG: hypothetical protein OXG80_09430 [Chloroflexi bacterium]|nr:hypothetical protein [Chloroflexota bacterium]
MMDEPANPRDLLARYDALPKASRSAESALALRHPELRPEWVIQIIDDPHDIWVEIQPNGERRTILEGRIQGQRQWIKVVFSGYSEDINELKLITAYFDRQLEKRYGGRPWSTE